LWIGLIARKNMRRLNGHALLFAAVFMVAGCGPNHPKTAKVEGHVTLDGMAVSGVALLFMPQAGGRPASAVTDREGNYRLTTFTAGDGALIGLHTVTLTKQEMSGLKPTAEGGPGFVSQHGMKIRWLIPERYSKSEQSGLIAEVRQGENRFDYALTNSVTK
jgi:hypothetical protein